MRRQLRTQFPGEMYHVTYYLAAPEHRPQGVRVERVLGGHGLQRDTHAARQGFERRLEARRLVTGDEQSLEALRRGWCLGAEDFKKRMLAETEGQPREHQFGELRQETPELKAQRVIREDLSHLGSSAAGLASRREGDPSKLHIATRLRRETTLSIKQIAGRLHLGTARR